MAPGKRVPSPVASEASSGNSTPREVPPDPNAAVAERRKPDRAGADKVSVAVSRYIGGC